MRYKLKKVEENLGDAVVILTRVEECGDIELFVILSSRPMLSKAWSSMVV